MTLLIRGYGESSTKSGTQIPKSQHGYRGVKVPATGSRVQSDGELVLEIRGAPRFVRRTLHGDVVERAAAIV